MVAIVTDGRGTPKREIARQEDLIALKIWASQNFGVSTIFVSNQFANQRDADR
jgi:hypothetical protein